MTLAQLNKGDKAIIEDLNTDLGGMSATSPQSALPSSMVPHMTTVDLERALTILRSRHMKRHSSQLSQMP